MRQRGVSRGYEDHNNWHDQQLPGLKATPVGLALAPDPAALWGLGVCAAIGAIAQPRFHAALQL